MANGRCLNHGGKSLSGIASPSYKHGRYSTALPTGLIPRFEASMADPDLLDQRAELALLDARIEELLGLVQANGETARWSDAKAGYQRIRVASHARRPVEAAAALTELGALLDRGVAGTALWHQLGQLIDRRTRVVQTEGRRLKDLQQMVPVEKVWTLVGALVESVRRW